MHSQAFVQKMKERLLEEKERLQEELEAFPVHTEMGSEIEDNSEEIQLDEVNQDIIATLKADLEKIEQALQSVENGTYGMTADGQQIPEERLEVLPWADTLV